MRGNDYNLRYEPVVTVPNGTGLLDLVREQEKAPLLALKEDLDDPGWVEAGKGMNVLY